MAGGVDPRETREERKERTRRAILDSALELSADGGLAAISLRQVAKHVGIVPTAFYRHFASLEDLGLTLVEESFASLRAMLREVRTGAPAPAEVIFGSVRVLVVHVREHRGQFGFIARERMAGPRAVRDAVRQQFGLVERELATDLARITGSEHWSSEDLQILAHLIVNSMVATVEDLLAADGRRPGEDTVAARAERELRMVVVGALHWRSDHP